MGGTRIADRVNAWILTYHVDSTFTLFELTGNLGLTDKQVRPILRRFINDGKLEKLSDHEWRVIVQSPAAKDAKSIEDNYDSPARRIRAEVREAGPVVFTQIDVFTDGALLLRSEDGEFHRAYVTRID